MNAYYRVIAGHDPLEWDYHEMVFLTELPLRRDKLGRSHRNPTTRWFQVRCNNPDCRAQVFISEDALVDLANARVPQPCQ